MGGSHIPAALPAIAKEATDIIKKESESFISAVLGETAKALGGWIADSINGRRHRNLIHITVDAKRRLADAGLSPKEVPLKIINPMLEAASLEEEASLQNMWANLLANAADPRQLRSVTVAFPAILKELRSTDARFLDGLYDNSVKVVDAQRTSGAFSYLQNVKYRWDELIEIYTTLGLSQISPLYGVSQDFYDRNRDAIDSDIAEFELMLSILKRHNLLEEHSHIPPVSVYEPSLYRASTVDIRVQVTYFFSHFGASFMKACGRPPGASPAVPARM
jgi:hypothetical protein